MKIRVVLLTCAAVLLGVVALAPASEAHFLGVVGSDIYGRVTAADGAPLGGAVVHDGLQATTTDSDGFYRLHENGVVVGTLRVTASKQCFTTQVENVNVLPQQDVEQNFALTPRPC